MFRIIVFRWSFMKDIYRKAYRNWYLHLYCELRISLVSKSRVISIHKNIYYIFLSNAISIQTMTLYVFISMSVFYTPRIHHSYIEKRYLIIVFLGNPIKFTIDLKDFPRYALVVKKYVLSKNVLWSINLRSNTKLLFQ